ncbi:hypothetical protein TruAng_011803 [Truncatella angustata]|nr:hypothetical protein TruAng_011803 [Truncatella angustata]
MGELNLGHMNTPAPFWDIANTVDLTQWRWTAPSAFENRHPQHEGPEFRPFLASLQDWLAESSAPQSSLSLGVGSRELWDTWESDRVAMEAVAPASSSVRTVERVDTPLRQMPSHASNDIFENFEALTRECIETFQSTLSDRGRASKGKSAELQNFCDRLAMAIAEQHISREVLHRFLACVMQEAHLWAVSSSLTLSDKQISSLLLQIYTAVHGGLTTARKVRIGSFDHYHRVYAILLDRAACLEINSLRLFQQIMASIPTDGLWRCTAEIAANIHTFLAALSRPVVTSHRVVEGKERNNLIRQANKMAGSLQHLSSDMPVHLSILDSVTDRLAGERLASPNGHEALDVDLKRFCWLHLLARLPQLSTEYLATACNLLDTSQSAVPLTQRQICEFFLARINSRYSVKDIKVIYDTLNASSDTACYASVSSKLWTTGQHRYVKILADFLRHLGRQQDIKHVVSGLRNHVNNDSKPLANLAIGLGHPQLALWVYIRYHQSRWKSKTFWSTAFAQETLHQLMDFKEMKSEKILDALRIYPVKRTKRKSQQSMLTQNRIRMTEKAAISLARTRHISETTALARITRCITFLQSHNTPVSPQVLRALFQIVTRDLAAGKPGRTTRLRWFLSLLLKETDTSNVVEVGQALERWRRQLYPDKSR